MYRDEESERPFASLRVTRLPPFPLFPLQGESLQGESLSFDTESQDEVQGESLSTNVERGTGGEV